MKLFLALLFIANMVLAQTHQVSREIITGAQQENQKAKVLYEVKFGDESVYTITKEFDYDIPYASAVVNNSGYLFLLNSIDAAVDIFNGKGISTAQISLSDDRIEYERSLFGAPFNNGIVAGISEPYSPKSKLIVVKESGGVEYSFEIPEKQIALLASNKSEELFAVSAYNLTNDGIDGKTYFYNTEINLLGSIDEYYKKGAFYNNSKYFLGYANKYINLIDLQSNKIVDSFEVKYGNAFAANYFNGKVYFLKYRKTELRNGKWNYIAPELFVLRNGKAAKLNVELPHAAINIQLKHTSEALELIIDGVEISIAD